MQENYRFLIEKLLEDKRLGLVLKPKVSSTLEKRLGPVSGLLDRAVATGRCYLFEGGKIHNPYPPAFAALCSDIAVHGHLFAATAGIEAALAGVPTLLIDSEGVHNSKFYSLGKNKVVFDDLPQMWDACVRHWENPSATLGFGDWSPMLDRIDPFRDGKAAERMGMFLQYLLDGLKDGLDRPRAIAQAVALYAEQWGSDKIIQGHGGIGNQVYEGAAG